MIITLRCKTCGAECQTENPDRLLSSTQYTKTWRMIHSAKPHEIEEISL